MSVDSRLLILFALIVLLAVLFGRPALTSFLVQRDIRRRERVRQEALREGDAAIVVYGAPDAAQPQGDSA